MNNISWNWQTDGVYIRPEIAQKDYSNDINNGFKTVLVTGFHTEKRYSCYPNPMKEDLMTSLENRHNNGFSTEIKTYYVPKYVLAQKSSWFD